MEAAEVGCNCACHGMGNVECASCKDAHRPKVHGPEPVNVGTKDGTGAGDHDQPYQYRKPSLRWTFPFTGPQYAKLLILRSKVNEVNDDGEERLPGCTPNLELIPGDPDLPNDTR